MCSFFCIKLCIEDFYLLILSYSGQLLDGFALSVSSL